MMMHVTALINDQTTPYLFKYCNTHYVKIKHKINNNDNIREEKDQQALQSKWSNSPLLD